MLFGSVLKSFQWGGCRFRGCPLMLGTLVGFRALEGGVLHAAGEAGCW